MPTNHRPQPFEIPKDPRRALPEDVFPVLQSERFVRHRLGLFYIYSDGSDAHGRAPGTWPLSRMRVGERFRWSVATYSFAPAIPTEEYALMCIGDFDPVEDVTRIARRLGAAYGKSVALETAEFVRQQHVTHEVHHTYKRFTSGPLTVGEEWRNRESMDCGIASEPDFVPAAVLARRALKPRHITVPTDLDDNLIPDAGR